MEMADPKTAADAAQAPPEAAALEAAGRSQAAPRAATAQKAPPEKTSEDVLNRPDQSHGGANLDAPAPLEVAEAPLEPAALEAAADPPQVPSEAAALEAAADPPQVPSEAAALEAVADPPRAPLETPLEVAETPSALVAADAPQAPPEAPLEVAEEPEAPQDADAAALRRCAATARGRPEVADALQAPLEVAAPLEVEKHLQPSQEGFARMFPRPFLPPLSLPGRSVGAKDGSRPHLRDATACTPS